MLEIKMTERPKTIEKLARHVNRQFMGKEVQKTLKYMERCLTSPFSKRSTHRHPKIHFFLDFSEVQKFDMH